MTPKLRFAHIVFRTNQLLNMINWYCQVFQARVVFRNDHLAFITFDDEHHRIALVAAEEYRPPVPGPAVGFHHAAFTLASVNELLGLYERLKLLNHLPVRTINHGPTLSFYYADPDSNLVEMQVDAFPDARTCEEWMNGPEFTSNPIGIDVEPEWLVQQKKHGATDEFLLKRSNMPASAKPVEA